MSRPSSRGVRLRVLSALAALAAGPAARPASLSIENGAIVLGRTESATVTVRVDEPPGAEDRPLRLAVNVGSFSEPRRLAAGKYRVTYLPPSTRFPQVALVAIWRETGPDARIDFLRMPLFGQSRLPVVARRGAEVTVGVGLGTFGPVTADRRGKAEVPIVVPPDAGDAKVWLKDRNGATVAKTVPVEVPRYNRLTAALVPHAIVGDGSAHARLDVYYDLGGAGLPADRVRVVPTTGRVTLESAAKGRYVYRFVPAAGADAREVRFDVAVDGDPRARASTRLTLGLPPPSRVVLRPPQAPLVAGSGARATLGVLVLDAAGLGLPGRKVIATANGEPLGSAVHRGEGLYEVAFPAPAAYPPGGVVRLEARVEGSDASAVANWQLQAPAAPRRVVAALAPSPVPADGRTAAVVELDVRDASGMPLEGAQLLLSASDGTVGRLAPVARGRYRAAYVPPERLPGASATLRVVDAAGTYERTLPLPLRRAPGRLLVGGRGGWVKGEGDLATTRAGLELAVPFRVRGAWLLAGATAGYATATQAVSDEVSGLQARSTATFVPVALRLAAELWAGRRLSLAVGAGALATFARFETSLASGTATAVGFGGQAFATVAVAAGPGELVLEGSWSQVRVEAETATLPAGGIGVEAGYRLRVF